MKVSIDDYSGYCFGVEYAIQMAEDELQESNSLYCLGDIVHNSMEVKRLEKLGLQIIDHQEFGELENCKVLIRAHGEPPATYRTALEKNITLIDASCPVVLKLQNRVKNAHDIREQQEGQIVIYGKVGHAEVEGLTGQTRNKAITITCKDDLQKLDYKLPITLFSQTTKSTKGFYEIKEEIEKRLQEANPNIEELPEFKANDSICRQVSNRDPQLKVFAKKNDVIIFVSGKKSSNGKALYGICKAENDRSYFVENEEEVLSEWFQKNDKVGICGATSTPMWLMEQVSEYIVKINS